MKLKNYNIYFFFAVLLGVTALAYLILKPFLVIFLIAVIFAQIFYPLYRFFLRFMKMEGLSSAAVCIVALLIVVLPLVFVLSLVVGEIQGMINLFVKNPDSVKGVLDNISNSLSRFSLPGYIDFKNAVSQDSLVSALKNSTQAILFVLQSAYSSVAYFLFAMLIMFFSLFYLLIDGKKLLARIMELSPLENKYEGMIVSRFNSITRATIRGSILIAIGQGILGGILFFFAGVSSPVFFGMLMMITSVIPPVGSGLVWFPIGIVMILLGHISEGASIILFGMLVISTIDNFIRPKLVGRDTELHPLLIIFSTLGGIAIFGVTGFIIGPVIMSLFVSLWDIYALEFKTQLREFNK